MSEFIPFSLNINGTLHEFTQPQVMGILNITPDSFYPNSRTLDEKSIVTRIECMISEGVNIIDIGAYSSRSQASDVSKEDEYSRLELGMKILRTIAPNIIVSIDTFRADVARRAIEYLGCNIINDISGGDIDDEMFETVARLNVPYILMHMQGTPQTMASLTNYKNVTADVLKSLSTKVNKLSLMGVNDVIIDPGFGFSKTTNQNYELLSNLNALKTLERPILVGISRKSMIYCPLNTSPQEALNGTTILNTIAILTGASILRVHDVKEAVEVVKLTNLYKKATQNKI